MNKVCKGIARKYIKMHVVFALSALFQYLKVYLLRYII